MDCSVQNNQERSRYELMVDQEVVGVATYSVEDDRVVIPHTEISRDHRGRGLGAVLVRAALDDVRASGHRVVPLCWYVAQFIGEHPEYRDLLAA